MRRILFFILFLFSGPYLQGQLIGVYAGRNMSIKSSYSIDIPSFNSGKGQNIGIILNARSSLFETAKIEFNYSIFCGRVNSGGFFPSNNYHVAYYDYKDRRLLLGIYLFEFPMAKHHILISPGFQLGTSIVNEQKGKSSALFNWQPITYKYRDYEKTEFFNYLQSGVTMNIALQVALQKAKKIYLFSELRAFTVYEYSFTENAAFLSGYSLNFGVRKFLPEKKKKEK